MISLRNMTSADPFPSHWDQSAFEQQLAEARTPQVKQALSRVGVGTFLLIDPMLGDPMLPEPPRPAMAWEALNELRTNCWERATYALRLPLDLDPAFAPYLVALEDPQDPLLELSVQWAVRETVHTWLAEPDQQTPHRVGGWLQSAAQGEALAALMSGWLRLSAAGAGAARYLRLGDRRVLSLAVHVLGAARWAQTMLPLQQWLWLDPRAALQTLTAAPDSMTKEPASNAESKTLSRAAAHFSAAQWASMALGPMVHQAIAQTSRQHLLRASDDLPPTKWSPVCADEWQAALAQAGHDTGKSKNKETWEGELS